MNHAQIDMLLQMPVPRLEPSPAARSRDAAPVFGNQLRLASDGGDAITSPAPAPSSTQTTESPSSQSRPSRPEERTPAADDSSRTPSESETQSTLAVAEVSTDDGEDQDDAPQNETAEVAALLAAAEQVNQSTLTVPADGEPKADDVDADDVDADAVEATEKSAQSLHHTEQEGAPAPSGDVPRKTRGAATVVPTDATDDQATSPEAGQAEPVESAAAVADELNASPAAAPAIEERSVHADVDAAADNTKVKPHHAGKPHEATADSNAAEEKKPATSTQPLGHATAVAAGTLKSAGDDTPKKSDRKATVRETTAVVDPKTQPTDRAAATARASEPPVAPSVAANIQQQLAASASTSVPTAESSAKPGDATSAAKPGLLSPFARLERGAHGTHRAGKGESTHHVDPARFVSRVARAIQTAQERGAPLQLRLSPPELGAMRLELSVNQGNLTATIETDNNNARQLLLDNLPALRDRLAEQNVKIERFDVDVRRDSTDSQQNPGAQDRGTPEQNDRGPSRHGAAPRGPNRQTIDESPPLRRTITNTSINVVA